ncbi:DUF2867 domain-containing protein [Catenulispora pinisilvae]|uniref:DUF2867 domain-containing protein n=1 Tax=Catenulispora pinisilvae TaxID=2705253 RepID=UPI001890D8A4|nr:DUF2867 domain-containing protein [Catenulispora pinisilvae]
MQRLPNAAHAAQPWLIHEIAADFQLEDVWALPSPGGGPDDFPLLLSTIDVSLQPQASAPTRFLFWLRLKLGALLRLDRGSSGLGGRVPSLRERLPEALKDAAPPSQGSEFSLLYQRDNERATEIANRTVHGVLHIGWVPDGRGGWRGHLAVLVKPNGRLGALYMAGIRPFRHLIVYPAIGRAWERRWRELNETTRLDKR